MNPDFMAFGHHPTLLLRVEQCRHRRHIERALDIVFVEQVENPRHTNPVAELAPSQAPDRLAAIPQVAGLVVAVERQRDSASRAIWPFGRLQPPPGTNAVDEFAPLFLGPLPGFEIGLGNWHASFSSSTLRSASSRREKRRGMVGAVRFELTTLSTPC